MGGQGRIQQDGEDGHRATLGLSVGVPFARGSEGGWQLAALWGL